MRAPGDARSGGRPPFDEGGSAMTGLSGRRGWALLALGVIAALAACGGGSSQSSSTAPGSLACKNGHILIGVDKGQTGASSFFDIAGAEGMQIAIDEVNASGGIHGCKIDTVSGDSQSNPAVAGQVAQSLIKQGIQILVVP